MIDRIGIAAVILFVPALATAQTDWPVANHDAAGTRFSPLKQINTKNVSQLKLAWEFDTLVEEARSDPGQARARLREALGLIRGEPLCDVACEGSIAEWRRAHLGHS